MLPTVDSTGRLTGRQMVFYCLCLLAVSLAPVFSGRAGLLYFLGAMLLGGTFLASACRFARQPSTAHARKVLRGSLLYLPAVLALVLMFGVRGL
jgi:protoheme IX farnesyltransferase